MPTDIDSLNISITSNDAEGAVKSIDALSGSLQRLKKATGNLGLTNAVKGLSTLVNVSSKVQSGSGKNVLSLVDSLKSLESLRGIKLSSTLSSNLTKLSTSTQSLRGADFTPIKSLGDNIKSLSGLGKTNLSSYITPLISIKDAANSLNSINIGEFTSKMTTLFKGIAEGTKGMSTKAPFGSLIKNLTYLPAAFAAMDGLDVDKFNSKIIELSKSLQPLSANLNQAGNSFARMGIKANGAKSIFKSMESTSGDIIKGLGFAKIAGTFVVYGLSKFIKESMNYVENLNLFTASLGRFTNQAKEYAEEVGNIVGLDPSEWMRNQGVFMTLAEGFGVASDRAYIMSKNLTQLGYDISSFFNIEFDDAMKKLQSGLSGELEPLRRLGYDLSQARLKAVALSLGIDKSFNSMNQAEKSQLRYHAIMTQVTKVQGDMARTLNAPANQLRILQSATIQAGRAIGNTLIPMMNILLPVAIAVTNAIKEAANTLAGLFGFSLPEIDYSGLNTGAAGAGELADNLENAGGSAKKLKSYLMGIDELNVIEDDKSSGGGGGGGIAGTDSFNFDLLQYDLLNGLVETQVSKIKDFFEQIKDYVIAIGAGMLAWKISSNLEDWLSKIFKNYTPDVGIGIALTITSAVLSVMAGIQLANEGLSWESAIKTVLASAIGGFAGIKLIGGTTGFAVGALGSLAFTLTSYSITKAKNNLNEGKPFDWQSLLSGIGGIASAGIAGFTAAGAVGALITMGATLAINVGAYLINANKENYKRAWREKFGEISLTPEEIETLVSETLKFEWTGTVEAYVDVKARAENLSKDLNDIYDRIDDYQRKVNLGVALTKDDDKTYKEDLISIADHLTELAMANNNVVTLGAKLMFGDSAEGESTINTSNLITKNITDYLSQKGEELNNVLTEAFNDGVLTLDEQEIIDSLTKQLTDIHKVMQDVENERTILKLNAEFDIGNLSEESFNHYKEKLIELKNKELADLQSLMDAEEDALKIQVGLLELKLEDTGISEKDRKETLELLEKAKADLQTYIDHRETTELTYTQEIEYKYGTIIHDRVFDAFESDLTKAKEKLDEKFTLITDGLKNQFAIRDIDLGISQYIDYVGKAINIELDNLNIDDSVLRTQINDLKPKEAELLALQTEYLAMGKAIPEYITKGLADINMLKALAGAQESVNFLIGQKMSTDPVFLNTLKTVENAGADIDKSIVDGLNSNTQFVLDSSTGMITIIKDGIIAGVVKETPILTQNLKEMGISMTEGIIKGAKGEMANQIDEIDVWAKRPFDRFKMVNEIHSPSKLFETGGKNIVDGLLNGLETAESPVTKVWDFLPGWAQTTVTDIVDKFKGTDKKKGGIAEGFDSALSNIETSWKGLNTWFETNVTTPIQKQIVDMGDEILKSNTSTYESFKSEWNGIDTWFTINVNNKIAKTFMTLKTNLSIVFKTIKKDLTDPFVELDTWIQTNVTNKIKKLFDDLKTNIVISFDGLSTGLQTSFTNLNTWLNTNVITKIKNMFNYEDFKKIGQSAIKGLFDGLKSLPFPEIKLDWHIETQSVNFNGKTSTTKVAVPKMRWYSPDPKLFAKGGFPDKGQLFVAREAGAEMVGNIRGKTAVANNDQIVDAVSIGVYEAMTNALSNGDEDKNIVINLDGEKIYENQQKIARNKGYNLGMGAFRFG